MMGILGTIPLLVGCIMVFKQRGGIVVIHAGIALMMFGELFVSLYAVENQARMAEGQTVNYVYDVRNTELAITHKLGDGQEEVIAIPRSKLLKAPPAKTPIEDERLPFDVQVMSTCKTPRSAAPRAGQASLHRGRCFQQQDCPASTFPLPKEPIVMPPVDEGAMYVKFLEKEEGKESGHLCPLARKSPAALKSRLRTR